MNTLSEQNSFVCRGFTNNYLGILFRRLYRDVQKLNSRGKTLEDNVFG